MHKKDNGMRKGSAWCGIQSTPTISFPLNINTYLLYSYGGHIPPPFGDREGERCGHVGVQVRPHLLFFFSFLITVTTDTATRGISLLVTLT